MQCTRETRCQFCNTEKIPDHAPNIHQVVYPDPLAYASFPRELPAPIIICNDCLWQIIQDYQVAKELLENNLPAITKDWQEKRLI